METISMSLELRRENDNFTFNPHRYRNTTHRWVNGTPWTLHAWWWYPEGGTPVNITSSCGSYYCVWQPSVPGMIVFDITINGERKQASHPINVTPGELDVTVMPEAVYPGDSVTFTLSATPDSIAGVPVQLHNIRWQWRPDSALTIDSSATVCNGNLTCRISIPKAGWMKATANYGGLGDRADSTRVTVKRPELSLDGYVQQSAPPGTMAMMASRATIDSSSIMSTDVEMIEAAPMSLTAPEGDVLIYTARVTPERVGTRDVAVTNRQWLLVTSTGSSDPCGTSYPTCSLTASASASGTLYFIADVESVRDTAEAQLSVSGPEVRLVCNQPAGPRGTVTACNAWVSGNQQITHVSAFSIINNDTVPISGSLLSDSRIWTSSGPALVNTVVLADVTFHTPAGTQTQTRTSGFTVGPRTWPTLHPEPEPIRSYEALPTWPDSPWGREFPSGRTGSIQVMTLGANVGPNGGLSYMLTTPKIDLVVQLDSVFVMPAPGARGTWQNDQNGLTNGQTRTSQGEPYCKASEALPSYEAFYKQHEGWDREAGSHFDIERVTMPTKHLEQQFESLVLRTSAQQAWIDEMETIVAGYMNSTYTSAHKPLDDVFRDPLEHFYARGECDWDWHQTNDNN